ncbi:hypothetical protein CPC16_000159 [Podila verticillata]|nr:hypothetical protein CPC16_000159 [Podila verticillata]
MSAPKLKLSQEVEPLPGEEYATSVPPIADLSGKPRLPMTREEIDALSKPRVLISGGGISGLTLAVLLHKADIPFLVLERAKEIKPLGSAIAFGVTVSPLFEQMGIYEDFVDRSKQYKKMPMFQEDLTPMHTMDVEWLQYLGGYPEYVISRPQLYDLLLRNIPKDRIILGKRVLSCEQNRNKVMVRCADNSAYHGDILVGADGAYSAVRQHLYKQLKAVGKLPSSDDVTLPYSCVCLVGQTVPLDPEEFPHLKEDLCQFNAVLGESTRCTWFTFTTAQNTVCWMVIQFLDKSTHKQNDSFRCSEWGPEAAAALAKEVHSFKVPGGKDGKVRTLGEYVDKTPPNLMSKVMLEEIVFDTWYSGRTVLIGDACHKMNPSGGQGAITAIHDAVTLANWLSTFRLTEVEDVEKAFKEYRDERYPVAKAAFESSQMFTKAFGKSITAMLVRGMMKRIPRWLWKRIVTKMAAARYQASFLPAPQDRAKVKPMYQRSLAMTLPILKDLAENPSILAAESSTPAPVSV